MHDGRLMRYSKKASSGTLAMLLDPMVPRRSDGALALCQWCQRLMWFNDGYLEWLANSLEGRGKALLRLEEYFLPRLRALRVGESVSTAVHSGLAVKLAKQLANERRWHILIQRPWSSYVTITRRPYRLAAALEAGAEGEGK